jgi:uncharacterized phage protein gp47/JayE
MSYVAEPYFEVAEQLLTGLTGGVARETHRFFASANGFRFEHDDVLPETVRAIGQANGTFFSFEPGVDFGVSLAGEFSFAAADGKPLEPAQGSTWPDEATEFHVSYYRAGADPLLSDRNVGSVLRTLGETFARELTVLRKQLALVYDSGFIDTAEGSDLDRVVALLAITRKRRDHASGKVRFFRDTPAPADIFIPEDTRVSTALNTPAAFVTTTAKVLRRGQLAVEAEIRAVAPGAAGQVAEKTITVIDRGILGIDGVENAAPTIFGGAGETDAELRARAKKALERAGRATPRAVVHALSETVGLKENDINLVEELALRPGVVQVFVARDPDAALAGLVEQAIVGSRAAGVRFEHNLAVALPFAPSDSLPLIDERDEGETEQVTPATGFQMPLVVDVTVFADNPRIAGADKTRLEAAVKAALMAHVDASAVGATLVYNRLVAELMTIAGVLDVVLLLTRKAGSGDKPKRNLVVPAGRRATLTDGDITVRFAGAPVHFDFAARVVLKAPATLEQATKAVKDRLVELFATRPASVSSAALMAALGTSDLYTLAEADLSWAAEYEEAGLVIRENGGAGAETALGDTDRALLRDVKLLEKTL